MAEAPKKKCPGYVRKGVFSKRCRHCGVLSNLHPPVELEKTKTMPLDGSDWELLDKGYMRWSKELWNALKYNLLPILDHVKKAWIFKENCPQTAHFEICEGFVANVTFMADKPRLGCCTQMNLVYKKTETLLRQVGDSEENNSEEKNSEENNQWLTPLIGQKGTQEHRHFTFLMERWRECKAAVLEYDKKIKSGCGREDFIEPAPDFIPPPAPVFGERRYAIDCAECCKAFGFGRPKRHCRHCLRVVCPTCAPVRPASEKRPSLRLCRACLPL